MPIDPDRRQAVIVFCSVLFEKVTEIKQGLIQNTPLAKQKCYQKSSDSPVAVQEGVNSLKLGMSQCTEYKGRDRFLRVQKALELVEGCIHFSNRRGNKRSGAQCASVRTNPILSTAELPWIPITAADALHEFCVYLADQSK